MKKIILMLFISVSLFSQKYDKVYTTDVFTSYFSTTLREPLYVEYIVFHGGGKFSRKGMSFHGDQYTASAKDYAGNGYDIGHMQNAENCAYALEPLKHTFFFGNALPQTEELNRGIWRVWESATRDESQKDSVVVICGGYGWNKKIGRIAVPDYCFRVEKNLRTGVVRCGIFPNDKSDTVKEVSLTTLLATIPKDYLTDKFSVKYFKTK